MAIPSGYSSLGLIGFTDKGDYNADTTYVQNDLCHNGGKIWKCKLDNTSGQTPAEGTYWTVFVDPTSSVSEMEDVTLTSLADGQELTYDATANKWKNTSEISNLKNALTNEIDGVNENIFVNGCVNLLENKLSNQSNKGVTVTVDSEGVITLSGALEQAESYVTFTINSVQKFPKGRYKLSGTPPTSDSTYWLRLTAGFDTSANDSGQGVILTQSSDNPNAIYLMLYITSHNSLNGIKFKPMITLADVPNSDYNHYVPYAKSNRELTDDTTMESLTITSDYCTVESDSFAFRMGGLVFVYVRLTVTTAVTGNWQTYARVGLKKNVKQVYSDSNMTLQGNGNIQRYATANVGDTFWLKFLTREV